MARAGGGGGGGQHLRARLLAIRPHTTKKAPRAHDPRAQSSLSVNSPINRGRLAGAARADRQRRTGGACRALPSARAAKARMDRTRSCALVLPLPTAVPSLQGLTRGPPGPGPRVASHLCVFSGVAPGAFGKFSFVCRRMPKLTRYMPTFA
jgi:hypothetical protein